MHQTFGTHIKAMRNARRIPISIVAQRTGIGLEDLAKIESGRIYASFDQLFRLADYFGVREAQFLQLNQLSRIKSELSGHHCGTIARIHKCRPVKNFTLSAKRIENMKRDLSILEESAVSVKLHIPDPQLRPFINSIVYCKGHDLGHPFEKALPDGTSQLQIAIGDGGRDLLSAPKGQTQHFSKAWVMGMNSTPLTYRLCEAKGVIYVRFTPSGLYAFTKIPQMELNNVVVDATIVFGSEIVDLWDELSSCEDADVMISRVEAFFIKKVNAAVVESPMIAHMLKHIGAPLTNLEKQTGYSAKYLTKTFQKVIGVGPKTFQRIQRFHSTVSNLNYLPTHIDWADVVFQHGYHDQAHFIKEFKNFSGLSPQKYLALGQSCARYLHTSDHPKLHP